MYNLCLLMFAASGLTLCFKNDVANNIIKRKGFEITKDPRSTSEKVSSAFKDYFYLLVPFYNVYKTFKLITTNDNTYASARESLLKERNRLVKKEDKKIVVKKEEEKKEVKSEPIIQKQVINHDFNKSYYESLVELKDYYYDLDQKYRLEYQKLVSLKTTKEEKEVVLSKIIDVDNKYKEIIRKIMIVKKEENIQEKGPILKR